MKMQFWGNKDFWAGMMLFGTGAGAMVMARNYPFGSTLRMGPGYFPIVLGGILIAFGLDIMLKGLRNSEKIPGHWSIRALIVLPLALIVLRHPDGLAGFIPALVGPGLRVSAAAGREFRLGEVLLLTACSRALVAVFIWGSACRTRCQRLLTRAAMELFHNLIFGFGVALSLQNLLYCFIGVLVGTLIGVLPGIGPLATIAMLLPLTFNVPPVAALIMLAGIYYGAQYGGSTTSILVNLPGETRRW